jgi:predicted HTH transcriptional regulator
VASLANTRGGVLVVGVKDRPREIVGLGADVRELESRLSFASQVIAKHIEYDGELVSFHQVVVPSNRGNKMCLVIVVAQASGPVGVHGGQGQYTYPVRRETGIDRASASEIAKQKARIDNDNHDFVRELNQFVLDN